MVVEEPTTPDDRIFTYPELKARERDNLTRALEKTGWKVSGPSGAAALLGVKPTTLNSRIKAMGLQRRS